jgi:protein TonB
MKKQNSPPVKTAESKVKRSYILEISFICSLILLSTLFYSFKQFENNIKIIIPEPETIIVENIPRTIPPQKINRQPLPAIPVESETEEILEDIVWDINEIDIKTLIENSGAPIGDEEEEFEFIAVQVKPKIILMAQPVYPEIARKSGTTGTVIVRVLIDKKGNVEKAEIFKSVTMLDNAALEAAKRCKFKPAMQRDKYVKVWMAIPFKFMLK